MANEAIMPAIPVEELRRMDRQAFELVKQGWGLQEAYVHVFNLRDVSPPKPAAPGETPMLPFEGGK